MAAKTSIELNNEAEIEQFENIDDMRKSTGMSWEQFIALGRMNKGGDSGEVKLDLNDLSRVAVKNMSKQ